MNIKAIFNIGSIISIIGFMTMTTYEVHNILMVDQLEENLLLAQILEANEISDLIARTKEHPNLQINQQELLSPSVAQVSYGIDSQP
jgi:hypothetical protein